MIIKSSRVLGRSVGQFLLRHLLDGDENDAVQIMAGGEAHLVACVLTAKQKGCRYAARHFIISPEMPLSDEQVKWTVDALANEFGFRRQAVTLVRHEKERANSAASPAHYHLVAPEFDPENTSNAGKVLSSKWSYARKEKISRWAEVLFGHPVTPGPHMPAVIRDLEANGMKDIADALRGHAAPRMPGEPSTSIAPVTSARMQSVDLDPSTVIGDIRAAYQVAANRAEFLAAIHSMGLTIAEGENRRTLCVYHDETLIGALHRLLGQTVGSVRRFMATPEPQAINPVPALLPPDAVSAEIERQKAEAKRPPIVDTKRIEAARESYASAQRIHRQRNEKIRENEGVIAAIDAEVAHLSRFGWVSKFWNRKRITERQAERVKERRLLASERQFLEGFPIEPLRKKVDDATNAFVFQRDRIVDAKRAILRRLEYHAQMIAEGSIVFADVDELQSYLDRPEHDDEDVTYRTRGHRQ